MRSFVPIFTLLVAVLAKPQYNYESGPIAAPQISFSPIGNAHYSGQHVSTQQVSSVPVFSAGPITSTSQFSSGPVGSSQFTSGPLSTSQFSNGPVSAPQISIGPINSQPIFTPVNSPHFSTPQVGGVYHEEPVQQVHQSPLITKQFYLHSAPEDHDAVHKTKHLVLGRPQKNYRVVFIKAPSQSNANVHLSAEYAPQEEKTVIYVLSQKDTALDIDNIATPAPTQPSKPEVFFIKYKTPEEAAHAQREIQNQYNVLGGTTSVEDRGHAPLTSVVGSLNRPVDNHALNTLGNEYLPVHKA